MLKTVIGIIFILLISFLLGWAIEKDPGYILINYHNWSLETSLWFGVSALIILTAASYLLFKVLKHGFLLPDHLTRWAKTQKQKTAELDTHYGICELIEENWIKAERKLIKSAKHRSLPFTNYVGAALAAQQQNALSRRDQYLQKAEASLRGSEVAVGLLKVKFQLQNQHTLQALPILQALQKKYPKHPMVLRLLQQVYLQLHDWPALLNLLPTLEKYSALNDEALKNLSQAVYIQLLTQASETENAEILENAWSAIPTAWKTQADILVLYVHFYMAHHQAEKMFRALEEGLKKSGDARLIHYYGLASTPYTTKQLKQAEGWLKQHPRDPNLLLCAGRLAAREQLWGKAQDYLNASLGIAPQATTYWELAQVQEHLKLTEAAQLSYKKGLALVSNNS